MERHEKKRKKDSTALGTEKRNISNSGKDFDKQNVSTVALTSTGNVYHKESEDSSVDYSMSKLVKEDGDYYEAKTDANQHRETSTYNYHRLHKHHFKNLDCTSAPLGRYSKLTQIDFTENGTPYNSDHINYFPYNPSCVPNEDKLGGFLCTREKNLKDTEKKVMFHPSTNDNDVDVENSEEDFSSNDKFSYKFFELNHDIGKYVPKTEMEEKDCSATSTKKRKFSTSGINFEEQKVSTEVCTEASTSTSEFEWEEETNAIVYSSTKNKNQKCISMWEEEKNRNARKEAFPTLKYKNATKETDTTMNYSQLSELSQTSQCENNTHATNVGNSICEVETNEDSEHMRNYVLTQYSNSGSEEGSRAINIDNIVDEMKDKEEEEEEEEEEGAKIQRFLYNPDIHKIDTSGDWNTYLLSIGLCPKCKINYGSNAKSHHRECKGEIQTGKTPE